MDIQLFPYGPAPSRLEDILRNLAVSGVRKVSLDRLEQAGVPKTQVSIVLSGLRQLGFVDHGDKLTRLCKTYLDDATRASACARIVRTAYAPLDQVVRSSPTAPEAACAAYLGQLGKGESAQEKILKLFWSFWKEAHANEHVASARKRRRLPLEEANSAAASSIADLRSCPVIGSSAPSVNLSLVKPDVDEIAVQLAQSLSRFCASRETILRHKASALADLENEIAVLKAELNRARETLDQHLSTYPSLKSLVSTASPDEQKTPE